MNTTAKTWLTIGILAVLAIILIAFGKQWRKNSESAPISATEASVKGCYVATLGQDVYTLTVQSQEGSVVLGTLSFKNFEKDSSVGTLAGTYANGLLVADYSFDSEGMHSVRQVVFKRDGGNFIEGFGPVESVGDREILVDPAAAAFNPNMTFVAQASCTDFEPDIVRNTVLYFGSQLKMVSVLSPAAAADMGRAYGPYVAPALLQQWQSNPSKAPGRQTSSPWPDRIAVESVSKSGADSYRVRGSVIETTISAGPDGITSQYPVTIDLQRIDGEWLITGYQKN